jgi:hypothetical protein
MSPALIFKTPKLHTVIYESCVCLRLLSTFYGEKLLEEMDKDLQIVDEEDIDIHYTNLSDETYVKDKNNPKYYKLFLFKTIINYSFNNLYCNKNANEKEKRTKKFYGEFIKTIK